MRRLTLLPFAFLSFLFAVACATGDADRSDEEAADAGVGGDLSLLTSAKTFTPKKTRSATTAGPNPADPAELKKYLDQGYGDLVEGPGESYIPRTLDGTTPPAPGVNAKRILHFFHMPDLQLADDESPTRLAALDGAGQTGAATRPQDQYLCRMLNAAVRAANSVHAADPASFLLLGGDNADSAQTNEVEWALSILGGAGNVECDSGNDDDPIKGPNNDGKDPFVAEGLKVPFKWVTGNHDILVSGNFPVEEYAQRVLGTEAVGGTRDYTQGGLIRTGNFVVADPRRSLLNRTQLMEKIASHGDGHGIGEEQKKSGKAIYAFDLPTTNIRFLVLDTATERGGADGIIHQRDIDAYIKPKLDQAKNEGKWVILASHHAVGSLTLDGGVFGEKQTDALTSEQWMEFVGSYSNVIYSIVGHSHRHRVAAITPKGAHPWWEVMTSAIADFPHEFRSIEIYDQDNGWLMMRATCVNVRLSDDLVAAEGVRAGVVDFTTGYVGGDGNGEASDRNVELWVKKPE